MKMGLNDSNFKVTVMRKPGMDLFEIYLINYINGKLYIYNANEDGRLVATEIEEGSGEGKPLLAIPGSIWGDIVRAINKDLPNIEREEIDAELKATKYHLEDMRTIVFKPKEDEDE